MTEDAISTAEVDDLALAEQTKAEANELHKQGSFYEALELYSQAIDLAPNMATLILQSRCRVDNAKAISRGFSGLPGCDRARPVIYQGSYPRGQVLHRIGKFNRGVEASISCC